MGIAFTESEIIKGSFVKMSGRLKPYLLIFLVTLVIILLFSPPLSFASKLPTVCNIFKEKKANQSGPCGHNVTFSKDKSHAGEAVLASGTGLEVSHSIMLWDDHSSFSFPYLNIPNSKPMRC